MKILQLAPQIPLPLDTGGRIGIWGITKHLFDRGNEIHFVAYRKNINKKWAENELKNFCVPYILDVDTENKIIPAFSNLFSSVPYNISKYNKIELKNFLINFLNKNKVDIIHIDHLHLGWCIDILRELTDSPVVLREHNLEMKIMQRFYEQQKNKLLKKFSEIQYKKFLYYEPNLAAKFDKCIMVSKQDEKLLLEMNPLAKTTAIGVGVNKELLNIKKKGIIPYSIFHLGSLEWFPNYDGLNWYIREIFPEIISKIPSVKLFLYGKGTEKLSIPKNIKGNVIKVGYVDNIWDEILDKQLAIVPLRIGSGIRVKIIEMLGIGQNIISTSIGKEGIEVEDNKHMLIADNSEEFIQKTIKYFNNVYDSNKMSFNSKQLISEKYTWDKIALEFENLYQSLLN